MIRLRALLLLAVTPLGALAQSRPAAPQDAHAADLARDPSRQPLTTSHALFWVGGLSERGRASRDVQRLSDDDGDGLDDLALARVVGSANGQGSLWRIDAVSSRDGSFLRTLTQTAAAGAPCWSTGGDLDGDGSSDLLVGRDGSVVVVSGGPGGELRRHPVDELADVAFVEDLDGDGAAEYAILGASGFLSLRSGASGSELWHRSTAPPARSVAVVGDLDGDRGADLIVHGATVELVSGRTGRFLRNLPSQLEACEGRAAAWFRAGDVDKDGTEDLFVHDVEDDSGYACPARVVSGRTFELLFEAPYPGGAGDCAAVAPAGDVDGDGHADLLVGSSNYNRGALGTDTPTARERAARSLAGLSLRAALALPSEPWSSFEPESGCACVYSGRTHEVLVGVWGLPYTRDGLGLRVLALPDVSGDGLPDLLVSDRRRAYAFAGGKGGR